MLYTELHLHKHPTEGINRLLPCKDLTIEVSYHRCTFIGNTNASISETQVTLTLAAFNSREEV